MSRGLFMRSFAGMTEEYILSGGADAGWKPALPGILRFAHAGEDAGGPGRMPARTPGRPGAFTRSPAGARGSGGAGRR